MSHQQRPKWPFRQRQQDLSEGITHDFDLYCPRVAPSVGVVSCTYHHWFMPFSTRRRYRQLPVSGKRMQRFLQFKLPSHKDSPLSLARQMTMTFNSTQAI